MGKKSKKRQRQTERVAAKPRDSKFDVLHESTIIAPHATHENPYRWYADSEKRTPAKRHVPMAAYMLIALCSAVILGWLTWSRLSARTPTDATDTGAIRTVSLAESIPAADAVDAMVKVERDDRKRPTVHLRITPKIEGTHDVRLRVSAKVSGKTSEGDAYTQVMENVPCDSPDTHVFSRDGIIQVQSVASTRDVTLWPNFDHVTTKGTVEKLEHIDVEVMDATPSSSVIDSLPPEECSVTTQLADGGKILHVSGTVRNPCDRPMTGAYILLTTKSMSGGCAVPKNRDDIPWAYGGQMLMVPIGDLQIGASAHIDYDIDISQIDVTMTSVAAVVADKAA